MTPLFSSSLFSTTSVAFICLALISGCGVDSDHKETAGENKGASIRRVHAEMKRHSANWESSMASASTPSDASKATDTLVKELNSIGTHGCPDEYVRKFRSLIDSLRAVQRVLSTGPSNKSFSKDLQQAIENCGENGEQINKVAEKYGVSIEPLTE